MVFHASRGDARCGHAARAHREARRRATAKARPAATRTSKTTWRLFARAFAPPWPIRVPIPRRFYLIGGSVGGALAPVLAREFKPRAIAVSGGFTRTWLEHMLDIERRRLVLSGKAPSEVNAAMRAFAGFYERDAQPGRDAGAGDRGASRVEGLLVRRADSPVRTADALLPAAPGARRRRRVARSRRCLLS